MKKIISFLLLIVLISLCGCSAITSKIIESNSIETLKGWSFQYNEGTNDYSLFFGLLNDKDKYISADVDVDIRIEDEAGNELYKATRSVSKRDFSYYTSQVAGEQYLANIRIKASEISEGTTSSGTVYLRVYKANVVQFDEVNCKALYCLPTKGVTLTVDGLPTEIAIKGYDGRTESVIRVEEFEYTYDDGIMPQLKVTLKGTKTSGSSKSGYDIITYKLYDSAGYLVTSSNLYLKAMDSGDKFKDDTIVLYDIKPGENYTLKLSEYSW